MLRRTAERPLVGITSCRNQYFVPVIPIHSVHILPSIPDSSTPSSIPPPETLLTPLPDQNDESLRKWKESLGLGTGQPIGDPNDPRRVIILSLGLEVEGRPDIIIELDKPGSVEDLKNHPFTIKEGATFRMKARFRVNHQILSGLKYVQVVSRGPVKNKMQEMIVCALYYWGE